MDNVRQWMSSPAIVAPETIVLPEARRMLQQQRIRRLPIVDAQGQLVGIVTEGDINRISASPATDVCDFNMYHRVADLPIRDVMTRDVHTVTPDTPIGEVAQKLIDYRIGGVPVIEHGRIVGVITESDLFRVIVAAYQAARSAPSEAVGIRERLLGDNRW
jgi:CBS domain-containing protein